LKYVDAGDLDDARVDFEGMNIESPTGENLGEVDGFVVDGATGRPYYLVVDAGGWFKSKQYLLPVGHVALEADRRVFVSSLGREHVDRFPGFDKDQFAKLSEADIRRFNNETCSAIAGETIGYPADEPFAAVWERSAYRLPDWWQVEPTMVGSAAVAPPIPVAAPASARQQDAASRGKTAAKAREPIRTETRPEAHDTESSPHFDGRAQPGDVLGIETGGETTGIGDTAENENARRRQAEGR